MLQSSFMIELNLTLTQTPLTLGACVLPAPALGSPGAAVPSHGPAGHPAHPAPPCSTLFVANLGQFVSEHELKEIFSRFVHILHYSIFNVQNALDFRLEILTTQKISFEQKFYCESLTDVNISSRKITLCYVHDLALHEV